MTEDSVHLALETAIEAKNKVNILKERFDTHLTEVKGIIQYQSKEFRDEFKNIIEKLDAVKTIVNTNQLDVYKHFLKNASAGGGAGMIGGVLVYWLLKLKGN